MREDAEIRTHTHTHTPTPHSPLKAFHALVHRLEEFRRSPGVIESPKLLGSFGMGSFLVLSCNSRSFVIILEYSYRYLLEVYFDL